MRQNPCQSISRFAPTFAGLLTVMLVAGGVDARDLRIVAVADGYARDSEPNGIFESLNTTGEAIYVSQSTIRTERGIAEFDVSALPATVNILSARLESYLTLLSASGSNYPDLYIHGYSGNGVVELSDATVPTNLIGSQFDLSTIGRLSVSLDTAYIQSLLGTASHIGLSLRSDFGQSIGLWSTDGLPFFEPPPTLVLEVEDVLYVDADAPPGGSGLSWSTAFSDLQDALDMADAGTEIWVAAGTYVPSVESEPGNPASATFPLVNGVALYGGFAGNETNRTDRDPAKQVTTLSGYLGISAGYAYHVVTANGVDATAILDGFTVRDGRALSYNKPRQDTGGGLYVSAGSPIIRNCRFIANRAFNEGAGIANYDGSQTLVVNCEFLSNWSFGGDGGGMSSTDSDATVLNCTFAGNESGVYHDNSNTIYRNCILWQNGGTTLHDQVPRFANADFQYCCIQGWSTPDANGNINADPLFLDAPAEPDDLQQDLRLATHSPCVDAGRNDALPPDISDQDGDGDFAEWIPIDLTGQPRLGDSLCAADTGQGGGTAAIVDMGAREVNPPLPMPTTRIYVDQSASGTGTGDSWPNAMPELPVALDYAYHYACIVDEVWVAGGEYHPSAGEDRSATFALINALAIYGGFAGTETTLAERNIDFNSLHISTLSGDIGVVDDPTDNAYSVVTAVNVGTSAVLDGFTIRDGYADGNRYYTATSSGGGIWAQRANPTLVNCHIRNNMAEAGAGLFCYGCGEMTLRRCTFSNNRATLGPNGGRWGGGISIHSDTTLAVYDCQFIGNYATSGGGGVDCEQESSRISLTNCVFRDNGGYRGGGLYSFISDSTVVNCAFIRNEAHYPDTFYPPLGGGAFGYKGHQQFVNCVFQDNLTSGLGGALALAQTEAGSHATNCTFTRNASADRGGGIAVFQYAHVDVLNSLLWDNTDSNGVDVTSRNLFDFPDDGANTIIARFSAIEDDTPGDGLVYPGRGNLDADPQFIDAAVGDLRLSPLSPCIDAGSNGAVPPDVADLDDDGDTDESTPLDLAGSGRFIDAPTPDTGVPDNVPFRGIVDLGAYEFGEGLLIGDLDGDDDVDLDDYALFADCFTGPRGPEPADLNGDGAVDTLDHAAWLACQTAPGGPMDDNCAARDFDHDSDADLLDFAMFQAAYGQPAAPLSPTCNLGDFNQDKDVDLEDFVRFQWALGVQ